MTRGKLLMAAAASSALFALASPASAAGFVNGSFEDNTCGVPAGAFGTVGAGGTTCITGWSVGPHSVDLVREPYWDAHHGEYSVDLAGNAPGSISQLFDTVANTVYTVNYWLSGNPQGGDIPKEITISAIINNSQVYSNTFYAIQGANEGTMNYLPGQFAFTATGNQTLLSFSSGPNEGPYGAVLDAVQVLSPGTQSGGVPEPATWAMMLLGFGAVGFGLRKRKATQGQSRLRVAYS